MQMNLGQAVSKQYFDSSVYRNILDMIDTTETIRKEVRASMLQVAKAANRYCAHPRMCATLRKSQPYGQVWPGPAAHGHATNLGFRGPHDRFSWFWLLHKKLGQRYSQDSKGYLTMVVQPDVAERALMNARSQSLDLKARIRNIEWELNRVHLPMVEELRASVVSLDKYVRNLPATVAAGQQAMDRGRIAAYNAIHYLDQMKAWLAAMVEKIKARSETDAVALAKSAAAAVDAMQKRTLETKVIEAAKTAGQAAEVEKKIIQPDEPEPGAGTGLVVLGTLAAGAALFL